MTKELLEQADSLIEEIKDIERRLKNIEKREKTILGDSVTGSEKEYPYIKRNFRVNGVSNKLFSSKAKRQYKKMLKSKKYKYEKTFIYNILYYTDWFYTCVSDGNT